MGKPSQKQLDWAVQLAREAGIEVPQEVRQREDSCMEFVREWSAEEEPTQKMVDHAKKLAKDFGVQISQEALTNKHVCGCWISKLRGLKPPSSKAVALAQQLAVSKGMPHVPGEVLEDRKACADFLNAHEADVDHMGPTPKQIKYAQALSTETGVPVPEEALESRRAMSSYIDEQISKRNF